MKVRNCFDFVHKEISVIWESIVNPFISSDGSERAWRVRRTVLIGCALAAMVTAPVVLAQASMSGSDEPAQGQTEG